MTSPPRYRRFYATALTCSVIAAALLAIPVRSQTETSESLEARIANLPPEQRAYERFRYWLTMLPPEQQKDPNMEARYRAFLKTRGLSDVDVDAQIKLIDSGATRAEAQRWNRILTAEKPSFNVNPNEFLVAMAKGRKPGAALDVGMGQGRNAIWLAQQGWDVTGFDPAEKAVALAQETAGKLGVRLKTEVTTMEAFAFGERRWDLILLSYVGGREMVETMEKALKPGGVLIIEGFHRDATQGRSIGGAVVFDTGQLPGFYKQLRVVRYEEPLGIADFGKEKVRLVRYCGERPE